jgi:ATP-dependent DNA helicase DinG
MRWNDVTETLAQTLPGFQRRDNQEAFGQQAELSFENERHLLAQMGTGTGKSFVNAATAHRRAVVTGMPVAISTGTKALQDQYAVKDLPFLAAKVIPGLRYTVLKGRANYLCMAKVDESQDTALKAQALRSADDKDFSGEISDTDLPSERHSEMVATSDECPGKKECPFGDVCFAEKAKTKAKTSHVVIVNHAVMAADMSVKEAQIEMGVPEDKVGGILPQLGGVVIDEADTFPEAVTSALGGSVTAGSYGRIAKEVNNFFNDRHSTDKLNSLVAFLFREVVRQLDKREDKRNSTLRLDEDKLGALSTPIGNLIDELDALKKRVTGTIIHGDDKASQKRKRLERRLSSAMQKLSMIITSEEDEMVRWLAAPEGKKGESIGWAPLDVAPFLTRNLWDRIPAMLTSATLTMGTKTVKGQKVADMDFISKRLGLTDYDVIDGGTPFDYKRQAMTFIPQIASPAGKTQNEWRATAIAISKELVKASDGRALLLFTSRTGMDETYRAMLPMLNKLGVKVFKQGDTTNKALKDAFESDERSVLFALKSFFTGVDVQGDACRLVILDKLPFPVPSDVVLAAQVALADKLSRNFMTNGFNTITVPLMALLLLQIYGRLIRTVNDWGMVAILDSRLYGKDAKYYGKIIMNILPDAPVTSDLDEAVAYLSKENA